VLRLAEEYLHKEDYRSAYLLMEQLVRKDPANHPARRLLAKVYEGMSPEQALTEWEILTKAEPGNAVNFIGYASAVLKSGQPGQLPAILTSLQKLEPDGLDYHRLAAASALAAGDFPNLRQQVERLVALEPHNRTTRFTQAALQLNSTNPSEVTQARANMVEFALGNELRIRATLALINDAPRRWPEEKIPGRYYTRLADELKLRGTGSVAKYVTIQGNGLPADGLSALIGHMKAQPALTGNDAVFLAHWLQQIGRVRDAFYWLDTLDESLRTTLVVRQNLASCAALLESWPRLEQLLAGGAWGPVPTEVIKQAFVAHALQAQHKESKAGSQWSAAIRLCEQSLPGLQVLQRLAQIWRWPDRQVQVLWVIVHQYPTEEAAWRELAQQARAEDNSAELWRVYQTWVKAASANPLAQGERLLAGLLARPGEAGLGAGAEELFHQHPEIPVCRVVRALALWRSGQADAALAVLEAGEINYAREPRFALVRGLVCATVGRTAESGEMFALAQRSRLLPEERALVALARRPSG